MSAPHTIDTTGTDPRHPEGMDATAVADQFARDAGMPVANEAFADDTGEREESGLGIDHLVDELARLAHEPIPFREFHERLLESAVRAMAAVGGSVWTRTETGMLKEECTFLLVDDERTRRRGLDPGHRDLLDEVLDTGRARSIPPALDAEEENTNVTDFLVLVAPVEVDGKAVGVVEILQRPGLFPAVLRGQIEFLGALCDLSTEYRNVSELRRLRERSATWRNIERFVASVHEGLDPKATAYTMSNDGRTLIDCDRMTVLLGRRPRVTSVSGVDAVQRRASSMRKLEKLVRRVVRGRDPLWYFDTSAELPRELEEPLQAYLDESPARMLAVVPLWEPGTEDTRRPRLLGAIVAERFDAAVERGAFRERVETVALHSAPALANANQHRNLPLLWLNQLVAGVLGAFGLRRLPKTLAILGVIAAIVCGLVFVPMDFTIEGRAELQPRTRREVFASAKGVVDQIDVDHGDPVAAEGLVAQLEDPELDYEFEKLTGELNTALQELDGVKTALLADNPTNAEAFLQYQRLTSEQKELETRIEGLRKQQTVLEARRRELRVLSPIDGHVLTWEARKTLLGQPVDRGQPLMTVADLGGDWIVEIHVPDHRIGHVLAANEESEEPLEVEFVLATEPDVTYRGKVERIAMTSEFDGEDSTVMVTVSIDKDEIAQLRPGATVVPRIHCGRRSVGYVWLHEIWETVRMRLLF